MEKYYTKKEDIEKIISERKNNINLVNEISNYCKNSLGDKVFNYSDSHNLYLCRQIPVSRVETICSKALSEELNLDLTLLTFKKDRFVTNCKEKLSYVRPHFLGEENPEYLIDKNLIKKYEKKKKTLEEIYFENSGLSLYNFHESLIRSTLGNKIKIKDVKNSFSGKKANEFYPSYLLLTGGLNCLLEDFHEWEGEKALKKFAEDIFEPAFEKVEKDLGIKPLIYQMTWNKDFDKYVECPSLASILKENFKKSFNENKN